MVIVSEKDGWKELRKGSQQGRSWKGEVGLIGEIGEGKARKNGKGGGERGRGRGGWMGREMRQNHSK